MAENKRNTGKHVGKAGHNTIGSLGALLSSAMEQKKTKVEKTAGRNENCSDDCQEKSIPKKEQEKIAHDFAKKSSLDQNYQLSAKDAEPSELNKEAKPTREVVVFSNNKQAPVVKRSEPASGKPTRWPPAPPPSVSGKHVKKFDLEKTKTTGSRLHIENKEIVRRSQTAKHRLRDPLFGCQTQMHHAIPPNKESDIVIGIDLGTSSTKVVVRDLMLNQAYAVPFSDFAPKENCYLLPTTISINHQDGTLSFNDGTLRESELKLKFIENSERDIVFEDKDKKVTMTIQEAVIGYLALAFREIRGWFFEQTQRQYADTDIKWNINIGIPSVNYDDEILRGRFRLAVQIAWYASAQQRVIDLELIKHAFREIELTNKRIDSGESCVLDDAHLHPGYFSTHPEVIMEVLGYVKSPLRKQGTHLLIDIGASTLDVATFRIGEQDGEDIYPMLSSKVAQLGSVMLHRKRVSSIKNSLESVLNTIAEIELFKPLPELAAYRMEFCSDCEEVGKIDKEFHSECYKAIGEVVRETKLQRDAISEVWQGQLPVFVCGGGVREKMYRDVIAKMSANYAKSSSEFNGFKLLIIPKPSTLQAPLVSPNEYRRLAVAYGLSFSINEIGKIFPQSAVEDHRKEQRAADIEDKFIGAEQV